MTLERCRSVLTEIETDTKTGALVETPVAWSKYSRKRKPLAPPYGNTRTRGLTCCTSPLPLLSGSRLLHFDVRQKVLAVKAA